MKTRILSLIEVETIDECHRDMIFAAIESNINGLCQEMTGCAKIAKRILSGEIERMEGLEPSPFEDENLISVKLISILDENGNIW